MTKAELPSALTRDPAVLIAADGKIRRLRLEGDGVRRWPYAAGLVPTISDDIVGVDQAMKLGFNWKWGPFELLDKLGPKAVAERLAKEGIAVPNLLAKVGEGDLLPRSTAAAGCISPPTAPIGLSSGQPESCCWRTSSSAPSRC